jgi:hypothetical protein
VLLQSFDELDYIRADNVPIRSVIATDLVCDARLVAASLHQFKDLGSDHIQAEHLAVVNVQQDSTIYSFGSPDCVGYSEHCCAGSELTNLDRLTCKALSQLVRTNSTSGPFYSYRDNSCANLLGMLHIGDHPGLGSGFECSHRRHKRPRREPVFFGT